MRHGQKASNTQRAHISIGCAPVLIIVRCALVAVLRSLSPHYGLKRRNLLDELIRLMFIIHLAAVVLQTVAHDEPVYPHHHIIPPDLVKHLLRNADVRSLVFHNHPWLELSVINHRVATSRHTVQVQLYLVPHQRSAEALFRHQEMHEMLANPLLWSQRHIALSQHVEHLRHAVHLCRPKFAGGQVEWGKCYRGMSHLSMPAILILRGERGKWCQNTQTHP